MKKLSEDHYIVMDDSEIKQGDWIYNVEREPSILKCVGKGSLRGWQKITHSTFSSVIDLYRPNTPLILNLSEVKELVGVVDVEKRVTSFFPLDCKDLSMYKFGIDMYNQALEDNKEKKYTEEDLADAINMARNEPDMSGNAIIQSLQPKTEWNVEIVDGILKLKK